MTGRVLCLVGAQYGSEGKGVIAAHLANRYEVHVRTGGPNAGHTFRRAGPTGQMRTWKMRSLPCGFINPDALLVIGAGAVVDLALLMKEIEDTGVESHRVFVDARAVLVEPRDRSPDYALKESIGATGEGVGPARVRRLLRGQEPVRTVGDFVMRQKASRGPDFPFTCGDTVELLSQARGRGLNILLEGTQGTHLDLVHGKWPYVTSSGTGAAQLLADAGLAPVDVDTLIVARTYPIRVAGNSGPLPNETTWERISAHVGKPVIEHTTVTKRVRRVGGFDLRDVRKSVLLNDPIAVALTFLDYVFPSCEGATSWSELEQEARAYVGELERSLGVGVGYIGTGGPDFAVIERSFE